MGREGGKRFIGVHLTHTHSLMFRFPLSLYPWNVILLYFDLVKIPALTLIDTLDTLIIMGNYTEFARSVERLMI
jgi:mannosidase alpha-like ER degradation enhancer 2